MKDVMADFNASKACNATARSGIMVRTCSRQPSFLVS
jgi:hypothetical protein